MFLAGEWIDVEHDDYDEGLSFEAPGGGDRSFPREYDFATPRLVISAEFHERQVGNAAVDVEQRNATHAGGGHKIWARRCMYWT